jgi:hypothetical protein
MKAPRPWQINRSPLLDSISLNLNCWNESENGRGLHGTYTHCTGTCTEPESTRLVMIAVAGLFSYQLDLGPIWDYCGM